MVNRFNDLYDELERELRRRELARRRLHPTLEEAVERVLEKTLGPIMPGVPAAFLRTLRRIDPRVVSKIAKYVLDRMEQPPPPMINRNSPAELIPSTSGTHCEAACAAPLPNLDTFCMAAFPAYRPTTCSNANACLAGQQRGPLFCASGTVFNFSGTYQEWLDAGAPGFSGMGSAGCLDFRGYDSTTTLQSTQLLQAYSWSNPAGKPIYKPGVEIGFADPDEDQELSPLPLWVPTTFPQMRPFAPQPGPAGPRKAPDRVVEKLPEVMPDYYESGPARPSRPRGAPVAPVGTIQHLQDTGTQTVVSASPGGGGSIGNEPSTHVPAPSGRGVKEKKVKVTAGVVGRLYGQVTEARDLVQNLWQALPKDVQRQRKRGQRTIPNMLDDLWHHWDELDPAKAVSNILYNELQDRSIGTAARLGRKLYQDNLPRGYRSLTGPNFGGRYTQSSLFANYPRR